MTETGKSAAKRADLNIPFEVKNYYVAVLPMKLPSETKGGIKLPEKYRTDVQGVANVGRVIRIGALAFQSKTRSGLDLSEDPIKIEIGDYVLFPHYAGMTLPVYGTDDKGEEHLELIRIMKDDSIIGTTTVPGAFLDIL